MRSYIPLMVVVIGCSTSGDTSSSTLQGVGSFVPNVILAERFPPRDGGGILQGYAEINILGGHCKTGHRRSVQNRPMGAETGGSYAWGSVDFKSEVLVRQLRGPNLRTWA